MNIILFKDNEWKNLIQGSDPRVKHIHDILKLTKGETLKAGIINGRLGIATIEEIYKDKSILFSFKASINTPSPLSTLSLIIGTPRPPTAKRLIRDLTALGVGTLNFTATDLGEKSYLTSRLWSKEEYKEALLLGASQAKNPLIPPIYKYYSLKKAIEGLESNTVKLALDNIESTMSLKEIQNLSSGQKVVLAIGPERGFSDRERKLLKENQFTLCSMGDRVLRTETACHMGSALILGALSYI